MGVEVLLKKTCLRRQIEDFLAREGGTRFDAFNLSDIFEYMSEENSAKLLERLADAGRGPGLSRRGV